MHKERAIAIGGSSGSIAEFQQITPRLPEDLPAAIFVVVHVGTHGRNQHLQRRPVPSELVRSSSALPDVSRHREQALMPQCNYPKAAMFYLGCKEVDRTVGCVDKRSARCRKLGRMRRCGIALAALDCRKVNPTRRCNESSNDKDAPLSMGAAIGRRAHHARQRDAFHADGPARRN